MALTVAHAGHWLPYVIPGAIVLIAVTVASVRERRRTAAREAGEELTARSSATDESEDPTERTP